MSILVQSLNTQKKGKISRLFVWVKLLLRYGKEIASSIMLGQLTLGQSPLTTFSASQRRMHPVWNEWPQGTRVTSASSLKSSMHTTHVRSSTSLALSVNGTCSSFTALLYFIARIVLPGLGQSPALKTLAACAEPWTSCNATYAWLL